MEKYHEDYHVKQIKNTYRSTEVFVEWLEEQKFVGGGA